MPEKIPMGIGRLGFQNLIFKRKFRFTFELEDICGGRKVPKHFVKVAARPSISIEETQIDFLNARTWIPGKAQFETMSVTYLDVADTDMGPLFTWLASVYNFSDPVQLQMGSQRKDYTATAIIKIWDGCGTLMEIWTLKDVWPTAIDFGDLDYSSSDMMDIQLTLRYSNVTYESICPGFTFDPCCSGCPDGSPDAPPSQQGGSGV